MSMGGAENIQECRGICEGMAEWNRCKECGGSSVCEHGMQDEEILQTRDTERQQSIFTWETIWLQKHRVSQHSTKHSREE
jgi:hypothetical protein